MADFNNLIGLQYKWGARPSDGSGFTDCFALSMEARSRLGLYDFYSDFQWVYEEYDETNISNKQILKWIMGNFSKIDEAKPGSIFYWPSNRRVLAMATVIENDWAVFISPKERVVLMPLAKMAKGKFFWAN